MLCFACTPCLFAHFTAGKRQIPSKSRHKTRWSRVSINLAHGTARPSEHELRMRVDGHNRALFERFDRRTYC
jgi:hypothetical protein